MREIKRAPVVRYAEENQTSSIKFSFVKDDVEQHSPVACRDFLSDAVYKSLTGKSFSIYSFDSGLFEITTDKVRLLLTGEIEELERVYKNYHHYWEIAVAVLGVTCEWCNGGTALYVEDRNVWLKAPWGISLFTHILRVFSYEMNHNKSIAHNVINNLPNDSNEHRYCKLIGEQRYKIVIEQWPTLLNVTLNDATVMGYIKDNTANYFIHNYSGFVSVFRPQNMKDTENVYRMALDVLEVQQCVV